MEALVHETAAIGYARDTDRYHRGRPSYHPEIIERVASRYGQNGVVELGAGTGILTRQLIDLGVPVIALEPVISMRTTLSGTVPEADVRVGSAENIPLPDNSVDTIIAGQAFHWFDPPAALDEIVRVLRPEGHLVTVWNVRDESIRWVAEYSKVIEQYAVNAPRYRDMNWRRAINADHRLGPVDEARVANPQVISAHGVIDRVLSTSFIAALAPDRQQDVVNQVRRIVAPLGPTFELPYISQLQAWRLPEQS